MSIQSQFHDFTKLVNSEISKFIDENADDIVALGPTYSTMSAYDAAENLRLYRMSKKFCKPSSSDSSRSQKSVMDMFEYDDKGLRHFSISDVPNRYSRYQLNKARYALQRALRHFKLDYSEFDLPTGETSLSSQGDVSIYKKLKDANQWRVSPSCFDLFATITYHSPGLKHAFRCHVKKFGKMKRFHGESGFDCFKRYLKAFVTFEDCSRITTVPKNNTVDRVILCEPMGNMIVQRCIAKNLVSFIDKTYDLDLYNSQVVHQAWLKEPGISTIDLSNASNSNWMSVIEFMLDSTPLLSLIKKSRICTVKYKETYHHLNMMSPMGNGFTFEVMTLILLAVTREFDSLSHVFGDDIIVDTHTANDVIDLLESMGYIINTEKTFINSPFRESCGGFYHTDYITSFDFWWANDIVGAVTNVNKLFYLQRIDQRYGSLWRRLVESAPCSLLGAYLYYTSWENNPEVKFDYGSKNIIGCNNLDLSSHIICHPRYFYKRTKDLAIQGNSTRLMQRQPYVKISKESTPYGRMVKGALRPFLPKDNISSFLVSHYLYVGVVSPHFRKERILIERWKK